MNGSRWKQAFLCFCAGAMVSGCRSVAVQESGSYDTGSGLVLTISEKVEHFGSGRYRLTFVLKNGTEKTIALHVVPQITVPYDFGSGNGSEIDLFCSCRNTTPKRRHWIQSESDIKTTVLREVALKPDARLEQCVDVELPQNAGPCEVVGNWHALGLESKAIVLDPTP